MATTKVVCRLLDPDGQLIGWTAHDAQMRGDGMLRASAPVVVPVERVGVCAVVSWHWTEVNVETRVPMAWRSVSPGELITVAPSDEPIIVCGPMPGPLPAVTVRQSVRVGLEVGQMGARGVV